MSDESNAYAAVIADLKRRRDEINETIKRLEALQGGQPFLPTDAGSQKVDSENPSNHASAANNTDSPYLGMSIVEATKALLAGRRKMTQSADIVAGLENGGLILSGASKTNTVASVLRRRQHQVGDVVSPKRGYWGLKEWYPGRNFGKKTEPSSALNAGDPIETSEPEQPSEQPSNVLQASFD